MFSNKVKSPQYKGFGLFNVVDEALEIVASHDCFVRIIYVSSRFNEMSA